MRVGVERHLRRVAALASDLDSRCDPRRSTATPNEWRRSWHASRFPVGGRLTVAKSCGSYKSRHVTRRPPLGLENRLLHRPQAARNDIAGSRVGSCELMQAGGAHRHDRSAWNRPPHRDQAPLCAERPAPSAIGWLTQWIMFGRPDQYGLPRSSEGVATAMRLEIRSPSVLRVSHRLDGQHA